MNKNSKTVRSDLYIHRAAKLGVRLSKGGLCVITPRGRNIEFIMLSPSGGGGIANMARPAQPVTGSRALNLQFISSLLAQLSSRNQVLRFCDLILHTVDIHQNWQDPETGRARLATAVRITTPRPAASYIAASRNTFRTDFIDRHYTAGSSLYYRPPTLARASRPWQWPPTGSLFPKANPGAQTAAFRPITERLRLRGITSSILPPQAFTAPRTATSRSTFQPLPPNHPITSIVVPPSNVVALPTSTTRNTSEPLAFNRPTSTFVPRVIVSHNTYQSLASNRSGTAAPSLPHPRISALLQSINPSRRPYAARSTPRFAPRAGSAPGGNNTTRSVLSPNSSGGIRKPRQTQSPARTRLTEADFEKHFAATLPGSYVLDDLDEPDSFDKLEELDQLLRRRREYCEPGTENFFSPGTRRFRRPLFVVEPITGKRKFSGEFEETWNGEKCQMWISEKHPERRTFHPPKKRASDHSYYIGNEYFHVNRELTYFKAGIKKVKAAKEALNRWPEAIIRSAHQAYYRFREYREEARRHYYWNKFWFKYRLCRRSNYLLAGMAYHCDRAPRRATTGLWSGCQTIGQQAPLYFWSVYRYAEASVDSAKRRCVETASRVVPNARLPFTWNRQDTGTFDHRATGESRFPARQIHSILPAVSGLVHSANDATMSDVEEATTSNTSRSAPTAINKENNGDTEWFTKAEAWNDVPSEDDIAFAARLNDRIMANERNQCDTSQNGDRDDGDEEEEEEDDDEEGDHEDEEEDSVDSVGQLLRAADTSDNTSTSESELETEDAQSEDVDSEEQAGVDEDLDESAADIDRLALEDDDADNDDEDEEEDENEDDDDDEEDEEEPVTVAGLLSAPPNPLLTRLTLSSHRLSYRERQKLIAEERAHKEHEDRVAVAALEQEKKRRCYRAAPSFPIFSPLSAEEDARVDSKIVAVPSQHGSKQLATSVSGAPIKRSDFGRLLELDRNGGWLNDETVNASVEQSVAYVLEKSGHTKGKIPSMHAFSSFFYSTLAKSGAKGVKTWSRRPKIGGENLLSVDSVFIPVNEGNAHWTLLVVSPKLRVVEYFDSFHTSGTVQLANVQKWVAEELGAKYNPTEWNFRPGVGPRQTNGKDCGVFVASTARCIAMGWDPEKSYGAGDMITQRRRIAAEILAGPSLAGELEPEVAEGRWEALKR
ncbi:MAG: hypothetical protein LQ340_005546 [Diploschistes diacapsis]|nr:MAG: hypothetical protein LQ340_005546 [Diploschistes diacapsis]